MKETGIIMSDNHPQLILDGRKTQTRRVIKPQPIVAFWVGSLPQFQCTGFGKKPYSPGYDRHTLLQFCPYGQVGDRLWGRETFMFNKGADARESFVGTSAEYVLGEPPHYLYKADDTEECHRQEKMFKWRPSIHMPRWASRINLEITEVRAERVQEITYLDALKEGISDRMWSAAKNMLCGKPAFRIRNDFKDLWDSLNAKRGYGWDSNCWVWVISFKELPDAK